MRVAVGTQIGSLKFRAVQVLGICLSPEKISTSNSSRWDLPRVTVLQDHQFQGRAGVLEDSVDHTAGMAICVDLAGWQASECTTGTLTAVAPLDQVHCRLSGWLHVGCNLGQNHSPSWCW